jgi:hypothetical protein
MRIMRIMKQIALWILPLVILLMVAVSPLHAQVTNMPNGISNQTAWDLFGTLGTLDRTKYFEYWDDFNYYNSSEWVISTTEAGSGDATEAIQAADTGILLLTNDDDDNDANVLEWHKTIITPVSGKKLWYEIELAVSDATDSDFMAGVTIAQATFPASIASVTGMYFGKDDGDANIDFYVSADGTATTATAITTCADDTYVQLGFFYDGNDEVKYYVNGTHVGTSATTNLPDDNMSLIFGIMNGEAAAKTLSVDYIWVIKER